MGDLEKDEGDGVKNLDKTRRKGRAKVLPFFLVSRETLWWVWWGPLCPLQ
jgi:hypothetical protein